MVRFISKESFGLKILYSVIAVIVLVLAAFTLFAVIREGEKTKKNLKEQGEMLASLLAHGSTVGVFAENQALLREAASGIMDLKDVSAVSMYNSSLKMLYATDKKSSSGAAFVVQSSSIKGLDQGPSTFIAEADSSFEFIKPVVIKPVSSSDESLYFDRVTGDRPAKVIGYVRIVLSKDSYRKEIFSVLERNAVILAIFIVCGIAIVYFAVGKVMRPLEKLTENVKALGRGMPVEQTPVESKDEIGNLASAFNAMVIARGQAEQSLRESEKKFRMLAETAAAAIFIYRGNSFQYLNSTTEKLTGYTRDELLSMNFWDVIHPDFQSMVKGLAVANQRGKNGAFRSEFKIVTKSGEERWVDFTSGIIDYEGQPAALGTAYDVTERKKLEEQYRQAQKMEAVGLLAGGVAHDFNNILSAIISYGYLAKTRKAGDQPTKSYIDQILACSERGANLTRDLLAFSRKQILNPKPVTVNEIILGVSKLLRRIIGEDVELKTVLSEKELTILADVGQVEQILMNLVTNARHAMPQGGSLIITTEPAEIDHEFIKTHGYGTRGSYATITVTDTGTGMDKKTLNRIFEPFFTTKDVGKGTGLGLSIVYGIVKQHKGYVTVSSELGTGTSFKVYFPLVLVKAHKKDAAKRSKPASGRETILVVEDDEDVRNTTMTLLAGAGYTVLGASDGEQAIKKFSENIEEIDLLVLDVIMPGLNGMEVFKKIRKMRSDAKAIFVTGYASDIFDKEHMSKEGLTVLTKPVLPMDLLEKIRTILDE